MDALFNENRSSVLSHIDIQSETLYCFIDKIFFAIKLCFLGLGGEYIFCVPYRELTKINTSKFLTAIHLLYLQELGDLFQHILHLLGQNSFLIDRLHHLSNWSRDCRAPVPFWWLRCDSVVINFYFIRSCIQVGSCLDLPICMFHSSKSTLN